MCLRDGLISMSSRRPLYAASIALCCFRFSVQPIVERSLQATSPGQAVVSQLFAIIIAAVLAALFSIALVRLIARNRGTLLALLSEREGSAVLLATAAIWSAPMLLGPGALLGDDWAPQLRAAIQALDSLHSLALPAWTFVYGNGISYTLQYPPLATLTVAGMALVTHLPVEFCFKLLCFLMHCVWIAGGYRFARALDIARLPAATGVVLVSTTQQYWATALAHGAVPSLIASSLISPAMYALARVLRTGSARHAALFGCIAGLVVVAQPVTSLFLTYTVAGALACVLFFRPALIRLRVRPLVCAAAVALTVAAPYIVSIFVFRPYNQYRFSQVTGFQFPSVSAARWLWWDPHIGMPPGIGADNSGYIGVAIAVLNVIAFVVALKSRDLVSWLCLGAVAWGVILVYWAGSGVFRIIPFVYLAKGTYRLWPFLGLALLLGVARAAAWLFHTRRQKLAMVLIVLALIENAPFSLKPMYHAADDKSVGEIFKAIPEGAGTSTLTLSAAVSPRSETGRLFADLYRESSLAHRSDFFYIHHEEIGVLGNRYWELAKLICDGPPGTDWKALGEQLRWLRINHLIVLGRSAGDYNQLGPALTRTVNGTPVAIVSLEPFPMIRQPQSALIQVSKDELQPDGGVLLPISYHPFLLAESEGRSLPVKSKSGYLSPCCVTREGVWLHIKATLPWWLKGLCVLPAVCLLGTIVLFATGSALKEHKPREQFPLCYPASDPG